MTQCSHAVTQDLTGVARCTRKRRERRTGLDREGIQEEGNNKKGKMREIKGKKGKKYQVYKKKGTKRGNLT